MSTQHWKGMTIPGAGDDLLSAWKAFSDTVGVIVPVSSVAAARAMLTSVTAAGAAITTTNPVHFDIGGMFYSADGTKANGTWVLRPFNETESVEQTASVGTTIFLAKNQFQSVITSSLGIRPYDRSVICFGLLWGDVTGRVDAELRIGDTDKVNSQFQNDSANQSVFVMNTGIIRAGTDPQIVLGVSSTDAEGKIYLSGSKRWNRLVVQASPITMA